MAFAHFTYPDTGRLLPRHVFRDLCSGINSNFLELGFKAIVTSLDITMKGKDSYPAS